MCNKYKLSCLTVCLSELFTWFEIQFDHMLMLEDLRGDHETTVWDVLISAEPLVQQVVGPVVAAVPEIFSVSKIFSHFTVGSSHLSSQQGCCLSSLQLR